MSKKELQIQDITREQAASLFNWLEDDACIEIFIPLLDTRNGNLVRGLIASQPADSIENNDVLRGRVREHNWILGLHDIVMDKLKEMPEE